MKKFSLFLLGLVMSVGLWAQILDPVKWSYKVNLTSDDEAELVFTAKLDDGWHLYSQYTSPDGPLPIEFTFNPSAAYQRVGKVQEPKPHEEMDEVFGVVVKSFGGTVSFRQKVKRVSTDDFEVSGIFTYQLCNDGSCIAPEDRDFVFKVKGREASEAAVPVTAEADSSAEAGLAEVSEPSGSSEVSEYSDGSEFAEASDDSEKSDSLLVVFLIALGGGILTMFTPCVFPMIPMTVNFFMHGSGSKRKGRRQAWFFGLSIVFIFAVLGVALSAIFGPEALNAMATHWIPNLIFFAIFMVFALSFFGLFEIKMPEKWVNASDEQADKGGFLAPFFIALTTVLVSFSCTGPIIAGALAGLTTQTSVDAESANRWVSLVSMLGFGIGFALPFTLLAMFPQLLKNLKSGSWLNTVKVSFAFIELAFGLKFLQMADINRHWGLLPRDLYLALWIVIFALWGFYLLGKLRFKGDDEVKEIGVVRLFLAIADFAFVVWMVPGLFGAPLGSLSGFLPPLESQQFNLQRAIAEHSASVGAGTVSVAGGKLPANRKYADKLHVTPGFEAFYDLDEAKAYARQVGKPIFLDFTGENCANCREMEQYVWVDPEVKQILNNDYVMCSIFTDVTSIKLPEEEWVTDDKGHVLKTLGRKNGYYQRSTYNMNAQPYYVVIDADGQVLTRQNYKYDRDVQKFVGWLGEGLDNYKKNH